MVEDNKVLIHGGATIWARQTIESDIFLYKPDKWFKIWFYIVNRVNHKDVKHLKRGEALITYEDIMNKTGATKKQVERFVAWSKKESMLATRKTTRGRIRLVLNYAIYQDLDNYRESGKESSEATKRRVEGELEGVSIDNNDNNEKNEKGKLFEKFWNNFGKKTDKEKCYKKFLSLKDSELEIIFNGSLDKYVNSTPDLKFRKNPLTWLNGKCWNDEITSNGKSHPLNF